MKLDTRRISAFLRDPGDCRVVLLYGDDTGLIRERSHAIVRAVAGSLDDPFRVANLERDAITRLPIEATALAMTGGRFVVRVREVTDAALAAVQAVLGGLGDALVVLEAPNLSTRSRLRSTIEAAPGGAAIGCYPEEGRALENTIRTCLGEHEVRVDTDALHWLAFQLGADRAMTRQELEKLALYVGVGGTLDLRAAEACAGNTASVSLDDALFAMTAGDPIGMDRALDGTLAGGVAPAAIIRAGLGHVQRLHRSKLAIASGRSIEETLRALRPPLFWRREPEFRLALSRWSDAGVEWTMRQLAAAERACRSTGLPAEAICRDVLGAIVRQAADLRARGDGVIPVRLETDTRPCAVPD